MQHCDGGIRGRGVELETIGLESPCLVLGRLGKTGAEKWQDVVMRVLRQVAERLPISFSDLTGLKVRPAAVERH